MNEPVQKRSTHSRDAILDAAANLVHEHGASALTLDATCARAGMSKGGLLYHFHSKEDLLLALVERHMEGMLASIHAELERDPEEERPGKWHRAALRSFFHIFRDPDNRQFTTMAAIGQQVLATEGCKAHSLQSFVGRKRELFQQASERDGLPLVENELIECVIDGLVMRRLRGETIPEPVLEQLETILLARTEISMTNSDHYSENTSPTETA